MAALFLTESDVERTLDMDLAIEAVTNVFRKTAMTETANIPRARARTDHATLHLMGAAAKTLGVMGVKVYSATRKQARFLVHLYDGKNGELIAVIEAEKLGAIRTGAASAVATQHMARPDASTVGVFGSGTQARTQLEAICRVRNIVEAYAYSPSADHRERFAQEMSAQLGIRVVAVGKPELAAEDKDIIITATTSTEPVFNGEWLCEGTHLCVVGSNYLVKSEIGLDVIQRVDRVVVDDKEQCRIEAGDLVAPLRDGILRWSDIGELADVVADRFPGRTSPAEITLFKSVGLAIEDIAVAKIVLDKARAEGLGQPLPF